MKRLLLVASAAFFAFPAWGGEMWLLRATLCLKTGDSNAECRQEVRGPYAESKECRIRGEIMKVAAQEQADADRAEILFMAVECAKSNRDI